MASKTTKATTATAKPLPRTARPTRAAARRLVVLVATRKGAWLYHGDARRRTWRADGPHFLGHIVSHVVLDPRDGRTLLAAAKTGHLGPTIFRSTDLGRTWKEAARRRRSPRPPDGRAGARGRSHLLAHAGPRQRAADCGTPAPRRRACSAREDGGVTWEPFSPINDDPQYREWMGTVQDGTPDGPKLHSIIVDPRDPGAPLLRHVGRRRARVASTAGAAGRRWSRGCEVVEGFDPDHRHLPRPALRAPVPEPTRPALPAEPLRHLPARPAGRRVGAHRQATCRSRSATSAFRWSCTRATPTRPGSSRWTARPSGRAPARRASPRSMSRATAAETWQRQDAACRRARPGGR